MYIYYIYIYIYVLGLGIPPFKIKILRESNPLKSRVSVRRLA